MDEVGAKAPEKGPDLQKGGEVLVGAYGLDQSPQEVNLHPNLPRLLNEKPIPVLPHPKVDLGLAPKSPE